MPNNVTITVEEPVLATTRVVVPSSLESNVAGGIGNIVVDGGSSGGVVYEQTTPSASWNIPHNLGRIPNVQVYVSGQVVIVDIESDATNVFVTFAQAQSGVAVLT